MLENWKRKVGFPETQEVECWKREFDKYISGNTIYGMLET